MITLTEDAFGNALLESIRQGRINSETDNHGQIVLYTNWFRWMDGTIRNQKDPEYNDDPTDA